jgi:hypothetical protein
MSRKSHPIGYKLGISYLWELPCNLNNYQDTLLRNYFLLNWLLKFCTQNFFYFFNFQFFYETRLLAIYSFIFYFNFFLKRKNLRYRKTIFFLSTRFKYRKPRHRHIKRFLVLRRFKSRYLFLYSALYRINYKLLRTLVKYKKWKFFPSSLRKKRKYRNIISIFFKHNSFVTNKLLFKKYFISGLNMRRVRIRKAPHKRRKLSFKERVLKYKAKKKINQRSKRFDKYSKYRKFDNSIDTFDDEIYSRLDKYEKKKNVVVAKKIKKPSKNYFRVLHLKIIQYKIFILRFKYFLEKTLTSYINKQCVFILSNLGNISFFKKFKSFTKSKVKLNKAKKLSLFDKTFMVIYNDTREFDYFKSLVTYVSLFVFATMYLNPRVLIQWFVYQIIRVRKHSLNTSHNKLIRLFTTMLKNAIYLSALLAGYRFEVIGKVNGSLRTKKVLNFYGFPVKRQSFNSLYEFYNTDVPTYTGILSLKLWLIK